MNVLSLFDGMSCGQLALQKAGIPITNYFASEIDKHAVKFTAAKYPNMVHLGSVTDVAASALPKIDILIGGSPCQGFSFAGKGLNFKDPRSALFFEYVRILDEIRERNPDVLFHLENVRMKKEHEDVISRILDLQPININSSLLSAQNRERLYWTNIGIAQRGLFDDNYCTIPQPKDKGIYLKDIIVSDVEEKHFLSEKASKYVTNKIRLSKMFTAINGNKSMTVCAKYDSSKNGTFICVDSNGRMDEYKTGTIGARYYKGVEQFGSNPFLLADKRIRRFTPIEVCRLQTVPDDYFFIDGKQAVSDTQIYKMCGNGWTVDVIAHILSFMK